MDTILIDLTGFVPYKNYGAQTFIVGLVDAFEKEKNYKKIIVCSKECKEFFWNLSRCKFHVVNLPVNFIFRSISSFFLLNFLNKKIKPKKIFYPFNISYTSGDNVYTYLHDLVCLYYIENYRLKYSLKYYILYFKYKLQFSKKANIAVPSNFIKYQFKNEFKTNIEPITIREGKVLKGKNLISRLNNDKRIFLINSFNAKHKNINDLLKALDLLKTNEIEYNFEFRFTGNVNKKISDFIDNFSHKKIRLTKTGYLDYDSIQQEIMASTAIIFCTNYEGFGIPVLEAMESFKPIICSDIDVLREFNYEGQYFYKNNFPKTLKNQILSVANQNKKISSQNKQLEKYDWNNIVTWVLN